MYKCCLTVTRTAKNKLKNTYNFIQSLWKVVEVQTEEVSRNVCLLGLTLNTNILIDVKWKKISDNEILLSKPALVTCSLYQRGTALPHRLFLHRRPILNAKLNWTNNVLLFTPKPAPVTCSLYQRGTAPPHRLFLHRRSLSVWMSSYCTCSKVFASLSNSHLSPAGSVRCGRHFFIRSHLKVTLVSPFNYVRFQSALFCRSVSLCPSSQVCYKRSTLTFFLSRLFDSLS